MCSAVWGRSWQGTVVIFRSDNEAVVSCLSSKTAREPCLAHLLRCLFFFQARFEFEFKAQHIAGRRNNGADALSRDKLLEFFSLCPQAQLQQTLLPSSLTDLLHVGQLTELDISALEGLVRDYFVQGLAKRTTSSYSLAQRRCWLQSGA